MSAACEIVRVLSKSSVRLSAREIMNTGDFGEADQTLVYATLQQLSQPGKALDRDRNDGVYKYAVRAGFDVSQYLAGNEPEITRKSPSEQPVARKVNGHAMQTTGSGSAQAIPRFVEQLEKQRAPTAGAPKPKPTPAAQPQADKVSAAASMPQHITDTLAELVERREKINAAIAALEDLYPA